MKSVDHDVELVEAILNQSNEKTPLLLIAREQSLSDDIILAKTFSKVFVHSFCSFCLILNLFLEFSSTILKKIEENV